MCKGITKNRSLSRSQQQSQARYIHEEKIRMSINLPYVEDTSEKLRWKKFHFLYWKHFE